MWKSKKYQGKELSLLKNFGPKHSSDCMWILKYSDRWVDVMSFLCFNIVLKYCNYVACLHCAVFAKTQSINRLWMQFKLPIFANQRKSDLGKKAWVTTNTSEIQHGCVSFLLSWMTKMAHWSFGIFCVLLAWCVILIGYMCKPR